MATVKKADIEKTMRQFLQESHGYTYLPEDKVEEALETIGSKYVNVLAYVKESKTRIKRFQIDKLGTARLSKWYQVVIR